MLTLLSQEQHLSTLVFVTNLQRHFFWQFFYLVRIQQMNALQLLPKVQVEHYIYFLNYSISETYTNNFKTLKYIIIWDEPDFKIQNVFIKKIH